jgi:hypothetical protein
VPDDRRYLLQPFGDLASSTSTSSSRNADEEARNAEIRRQEEATRRAAEATRQEEEATRQAEQRRLEEERRRAEEARQQTQRTRRNAIQSFFVKWLEHYRLDRRAQRPGYTLKDLEKSVDAFRRIDFENLSSHGLAVLAITQNMPYPPVPAECVISKNHHEYERSSRSAEPVTGGTRITVIRGCTNGKCAAEFVVTGVSSSRSSIGSMGSTTIREPW